MEVSALKHAGVAGIHGRSPLLRLQSDERLVALVRRGNQHAFEALISRYQSRLLGFCRHMLGSREDAEDVLQEVFAAAFNAMQADERPINVRPWLYRIARNRSLNHLRRVQPIGVDSMDVHLSENGMTTADKVHRREEFRLLLVDVQDLPETQRTALLLREIDAMSYDQIAEAMETTIPSVKSLLVRARVSLAEAAEARQLSCDDVRLELGEVAEGLKRMTPPVRRHLKQCDRCSTFRRQLKETNKALAAVLPIGPLLVVKKLIAVHLGGSAASAGGGAGSAAATGAATAAGTAAAGGAAGGLLGAGASAVATKAAAGLAAAAIVGVGAVEVSHVTQRAATDPVVTPARVAPAATGGTVAQPKRAAVAPRRERPEPKPRALAVASAAPVAAAPAPATAAPAETAPEPAPRTETVTNTTVLPSGSGDAAPGSTTPTAAPPGESQGDQSGPPPAPPAGEGGDSSATQTSPSQPPPSQPPAGEPAPPPGS